MSEGHNRKHAWRLERMPDATHVNCHAPCLFRVYPVFCRVTAYYKAPTSHGNRHSRYYKTLTAESGQSGWERPPASAMRAPSTSAPRGTMCIMPSTRAVGCVDCGARTDADAAARAGGGDRRSAIDGGDCRAVGFFCTMPGSNAVMTARGCAGQAVEVAGHDRHRGVRDDDRAGDRRRARGREHERSVKRARG